MVRSFSLISQTGSMGALKDQLKSDLTQAMRERDELRTATLRMALAALTVEEVSGSEARDLSDDEVVKVLGREAKKRREAAQAFDEAGRPELAERERAEGRVLDDYLPVQLGDDELDALVAAAVATVRASGQDGPRAMGAVMKELQPQVSGRADGGRVAAAVRQALGA
jgi:uncharacterized protein YqeY